MLIFCGTWYLLSKLPPIMEKNIESPAVCVTIVLSYVTCANIVGQVAGVIFCLLTLYEPNAKNISFKCSVEDSLRHYYHVRMLRIYMIFLMEWSLTNLSIWALVIIVCTDAIFMLYAYLTLDAQIEAPVNEYYQNVNHLPSNYPIPLDIFDAIDKCEVAKSVFKSHDI
jgi:hypothetical protein